MLLNEGGKTCFWFQELSKIYQDQKNISSSYMICKHFGVIPNSKTDMFSTFRINDLLKDIILSCSVTSLEKLAIIKQQIMQDSNKAGVAND